MRKIKFQLDEGAFVPEKAHKEDAGFDIKSPNTYVVPLKSSVVINTGVHVELPKNTVGMIKSRSGLNVRYGIQAEGVIDVGYTGSLIIKLYNSSKENYVVSAGDKIAQLVIIKLKPCYGTKIVKSIKSGKRGNNGFGSTGK